MNIINNESIIFFDVDDTLVMWQEAKKGQKAIGITCPYDGRQEYLLPHAGHIKILKDRKARGSVIVVWSAGGFQWAEAVVKALGLADYVDFVMSKPHAYVDDKMSDEFMGERIYLPYGGRYGQD